MANIFGSIDNPFDKLGGGYGSLTDTNNGPITLLSNLFQLIALVAGIWGLVNLIMAGLKFISSNGDPQIIEAAQKQMYMSLIGLIIVIMSYTAAALIGQLLFGRSDFIFSPQIFGPGTVTP
jgi:hypothetical protein